MFRRILRDLTTSDLIFAGPVVLAILAFVRAGLAGEAFERWAWIACGAVMVIVGAAYLVWVWRRRGALDEE
jgi:uncharacterized membrane protein